MYLHVYIERDGKITVPSRYLVYLTLGTIVQMFDSPQNLHSEITIP